MTRKTYEVMVEGRIVSCTLRGKVVSDQIGYTAVRAGDDVFVRMISAEEGVIEKILPRRSALSRKIESREFKEQVIAANIDQILIIMSTQDPPFKSGLLDRYLVIAEKNHLKALICINKIDLAPKEKFLIYQSYYSALGYETLFTSAVTGEGLEKLKRILRDSATAMVGHSGVGKSSLIKALEPGLDIRIQSIRSGVGKGQHTTTSVQFFPLSFGGFVADTPGIRELGLWDVYKRELREYFIEFHRYAPDCQFADCLHINEPGCAVKAAVSRGEILKERYENYLNIYASLKSAPYE